MLSLQPRRAANMAAGSHSRFSKAVYSKIVIMHSVLPPNYGLMHCIRAQSKQQGVVCNRL